MEVFTQRFIIVFLLHVRAFMEQVTVKAIYAPLYFSLST
eukprot:XP_001706171.1 Hypothetical protein GL50803_39060 [Giardia lamblia ATCC 50803]